MPHNASIRGKNQLVKISDAGAKPTVFCPDELTCYTYLTHKLSFFHSFVAPNVTPKGNAEATIRKYLELSTSVVWNMPAIKELINPKMPQPQKNIVAYSTNLDLGELNGFIR